MNYLSFTFPSAMYVYLFLKEDCVGVHLHVLHLLCFEA